MNRHIYRISTSFVTVAVLLITAPHSSSAKTSTEHETVSRQSSTASSMPVPFVENEIAEIVQAIGDLFQERYPDEAIALKMADRLRTMLQSGAFDDVETRGELAVMLQRELRSVRDDKHIQIDFRYPAKTDNAQKEKTSDDADKRPPARTGIRELRLLEGGVAYLRVISFSQADLDAGLYDAAARVMATADAVIVDLRGNGGGSSRAANELIATFLGPKTVHFGTLRSRKGSMDLLTQPSANQTFVESAPLYILIDKNTGSAAEAVAYHLKHLGRATVVGERSSGAANLSMTVSLEVWDDAEENVIGSYTLILPKAEIVNVNTGRSWEGEGVVPDKPTDAESALAESHVLAIRASHPSAQWTTALTASVRAGYQPATVTLKQLERLAGSYEQGRHYRCQGGRLYTGDGSGDELELVPITPTSFRYKSGISATVHFDVREDGTVEAARIVFPDGGYERFARLTE